ncbi:MAG: tetraacyldisaccharide 4'-kinase, partial [Planctomycetota bacterium]|nr:tetraacyldisaccharide 4'-kinase [Planctomycetota bacterium]
MTQGPAGPWSALLRPFSWVYGPLSARQIKRKQQRAVRVDVPVISVGNLAVGGTGKSPFVRLLVGWLQEAGHQPAIAMRGYGAANPNEADEVWEHRLACPDVPVLAGDTVCTHQGEVLGKPRDRDHARVMLRAFRG